MDRRGKPTFFQLVDQINNRKKAPCVVRQAVLTVSINMIEPNALIDAEPQIPPKKNAASGKSTEEAVPPLLDPRSDAAAASVFVLQQEEDPYYIPPRDVDDAPPLEEVVVGPCDVLLGRGKGMESHHGNQLFQRTFAKFFNRGLDANNKFSLFHSSRLFPSLRLSLYNIDLIRCNVVRYVHAENRLAKRDIIDAIVASIEEKGRFLKSEGRTWRILDKDEARKKVSHALQYHLRSLR